MRQIRPLCGDGFHRRRQLERELPCRTGAPCQHVDQGVIAQAEVGDERACRLFEWCQNRRPIEIYGHDCGNGRCHAHDRVELRITALESKTAFVQELAEDILRV